MNGINGGNQIKDDDYPFQLYSLNDHLMISFISHISDISRNDILSSISDISDISDISLLHFASRLSTFWLTLPNV